MLLTTHYMFEADSLCDRIAVIAKGEIVGEGTPRELKSRVAEGSVARDRGLRRAARSASSGCAPSTGVRTVSVEEREQAQLLVVQTDSGHRADARCCSATSTARTSAA